MITAEELTKQRGGRAVVSDVTFRCEPGTITAAGSSRFFSLALRAGAAMAQDDFAAGDSQRRRAHCCFGRQATANRGVNLRGPRRHGLP
jgi:hypothetical protein